MVAYKIEIRGLVQGVGFRPFVYKLALRHNISGHVENNNKGVLVWAEGNKQALGSFMRDIKKEAPAASEVALLEVEENNVQGIAGFRILPSRSYSEEVTEVSPDIAVCDACLGDLKSQPHRLDYPFINCTHCGPRFSIIKALPYDRQRTTMEPFRMCDKCRTEYTDVMDRRFHAQPVACNRCGPSYALHFPDGRVLKSFPAILQQVAQMLDEGKILAIKGLGGFHLACNALDDRAVETLRIRKNREGKPFAVMFSGVKAVKDYLSLNGEEERLLTSWRRPVVLLRTQKPLPYAVSNGLNSVGAMLPYMPFHFQLFEKLKTGALVMTSGNLSGEPVVIDNREALEKLEGITDAILTYNREIYNRVDDSVAMVVNGKERLIRRSRSYAPASVSTGLCTEGIFAAGAELVNCFAIGKGNRAFPSQYIGDLKNPETLSFYEESFRRFSELFRFTPSVVAVDLHPDYFSTRFAMDTGLPVERVQHHHAHVASCMAEHGLDEKVIGVSLDGTGLGTDGKIWGGEFLVCDLEKFERPYHFEYVLQPGGDAVIHQPWRMAMAYLYHYFGAGFLREKGRKFFPGLPRNAFETVLLMLENRLNCPETSSAGRLFDAVSALLQISRETTFHAEAPMRLESVAGEKVTAAYPFSVGNGRVSFRPLFKGLLSDMENGVPVSYMAGKFHQTLAESIGFVVKKTSKETGLKKVALSGGSFQNKILLSKTEQMLERSGFAVYSHHRVPANDGGIALGQLAVAARRRSLIQIKNQKNKTLCV